MWGWLHPAFNWLCICQHFPLSKLKGNLGILTFTPTEYKVGFRIECKATDSAQVSQHRRVSKARPHTQQCVDTGHPMHSPWFSWAELSEMSFLRPPCFWPVWNKQLDESKCLMRLKSDQLRRWQELTCVIGLLIGNKNESWWGDWSSRQTWAKCDFYSDGLSILWRENKLYKSCHCPRSKEPFHFSNEWIWVNLGECPFRNKFQDNKAVTY